MSIGLGAVALVAVFLLAVAGAIVAASRKGFGAEVVLAVAVVLSLALAWAGLWMLFDLAASNDLRGLVITLAGVATVITSGIVYAKILRVKEPKETE